MGFGREELERLRDRLAYYGEGAIRDVTPRQIFSFSRMRLFRAIAEQGKSIDAQLLDRVNLCNQLSREVDTTPATRLRRVSRRKSRYFYDLNAYLKYFPSSLRIDYLFGDVTFVPDRPTIVKSRPIVAGNTNSILLNLDKLRHFKLTADSRRWNDKIGKAVWRGGCQGPRRPDLIRRHALNPAANIGQTGKAFEGVSPKPFMSRLDQMAYRYIVSVEGNDVATNLKWIMASNSLCLMPRPRFETWFLESRLQPDIHYVELADDFSDLDEKIGQLEADPVRAQRIVTNAKAYVERMADRRTERIVSLLVLQKYFEATGQLPPSGFSRLLFGDA